VIIVGAAVGAAVGVESGKKKPSNSSPSSSGGSGNGGTTSSQVLTGKDGSTVKMDDGTSFVYTNAFDGDWAVDPENPFAEGGKAQNWSPRIGKEEWVWGTDVVKGVNLG